MAALRPRTLPTVPAAAARRLLLGAQGLLDDPSRPATLRALRGLVSQLGFVQMDSISTVARAHELTLHARLDGYAPAQLVRLHDRDRFLFEHWTHDASVIPTTHYRHWIPRFERDRARIEGHAWWRHLLGPRAGDVARDVKRRIEREGPLRASDFEQAGTGGFWQWTPEKAALEYLWRTGELAVRRRVQFQKVYDLTARVLPDHHALPEPTPEEHLAWAGETAAARLMVFTSTELARFWGALTLAEARRWCAEQVTRGTLVEVSVESADGTPPRPAFALADWEDRLAALPPAPERIRLLAPFDPVIRDRDRALRRFGFDYRFEAYTPAKKRVHGYYVLPILEGEALIGRIEPKLVRDQDRLIVLGLHWERGVRVTRARKAALTAALHRLATFVGASDVDEAVARTSS